MLPIWHPLWWITIQTARFTVTALFRLRTEGRIGPADRPLIVAGKHCSNWDVPVLAVRIYLDTGRYPCFEMGSFHGYPVLGRITAILRRVGGFPVMRSKDLLRLKHKTGQGREELSELMRGINGAAAETRKAILRKNAVLSYFPEGSRDRTQITRLRSRHEIGDAIEQGEAEDLDVHVVPVLPCYGPRVAFPIPFLRRTSLTLKVLEPIRLRGRTIDEIMERLTELFREHWTPAS